MKTVRRTSSLLSVRVHSWLRAKTLSAAAILALLVPLHADDDTGAKPGFFKRALQKTKDGAGAVWDVTKGVGQKTAKAVTSPFHKKGRDENETATVWKNLAVTMKLDPPRVRIGETRALDVTVSIVNSGKTAVSLEFPSSLRMDVVVKAAGGRIVSRWSDDQKIDREPGVLVINPKEHLEYSAIISTREMTAGGTFEIEAYFPSHERLRVSKTVVVEN